ncbi:hypothetical protein KCQ_04911 [Pectobacterium atrosepticum ICMP 1526]|uniref:hypothetical protein n=1 Tax=Pectobacterium atrosepticum TaxID=29471 RepID=UPI00057F034A|nr:hypothetical protein [Pectobacterium atrosepticum]KMK87552.1 hypothetical protein KCQ_04911 [Pectobacterium atrosepticum ICMP 1526]QXE13041.1 hypothetical protein DCX48_00155 [Pectobacterium atrosepticum]
MDEEITVNISEVRTRAKQLVAKWEPMLKQGTTVGVSNVTKYGDEQIEIRREGGLYWRAWTFEDGFLTDFEKNLDFSRC